MTTILATFLLAHLLPPNDAGVSMGHLHLLVSDPTAARVFWVDGLGGAPIKVASYDAVKIPGAIVIFKAGKPSGGTVGSVINHLGVKVKSLSAYAAKLTAAGFTVEPGANPSQAMVNGPDAVRVEMTEDPSLPTPIAHHHIHWYTPAPKEIQAWYAANFGAVPGMRGKFDAADIPGANLSFSQSPATLEPTKGRGLDHIGFEVKDLATFCKKLEAKGIKFDIPYRQGPAPDLWIAFFTDPWGTYVELTQGLNKF
jgi:catechol 2,3-dioxygenase-like lactoylglutathione lyase family enzyme